MELTWTHVALPPSRAMAGWQARGAEFHYLTGRKDGGSGVFLCRWQAAGATHLDDLIEACRTVTDVSTPDEGRRIAELFEAGEDIPEIGWFHGPHTAQVTT
jgi:hypothetical protein